MNQFYSVITSLNDKAVNQVHFKKKTSAVDNITELFKRCYPEGFKIKDLEFIESPEFESNNRTLVKFYTERNYCYEIVTNHFED